MTQNEDNPGFDIREVNTRHIHTVDKFFRMFAGAASKLVSYGDGTIEIEARLGISEGRFPGAAFYHHLLPPVSEAGCGRRGR
jgi:hypothetical protein